jgi:hypothetical protein
MDETQYNLNNIRDILLLFSAVSNNSERFALRDHGETILNGLMKLFVQKPIEEVVNLVKVDVLMVDDASVSAGLKVG